jgi:small subunit ribosomal protein S1
VEQEELLEAFTDEAGEVVDLDALFRGERLDYRANRVVPGRVTGVLGDAVVVDIGYKSEGGIPLGEWGGLPPAVGDAVRVFLAALEDDSGAVVLSHRKAREAAVWDAARARYRAGAEATGTVRRRVKGGLLVELSETGAPAFLPASQVDLRRPQDLGEYIGRLIECQVLEIDAGRRSLVVSRRELLEGRRRQVRVKLLAEIREGEVRAGVVRNVTSFGAFVDLGGLEGLLHLSELAWQRVHDPHEVVRLGQALDVYVLRVERERGRVALSLKRLTPRPWRGVAEKYPVGSRHPAEVPAGA